MATRIFCKEIGKLVLDINEALCATCENFQTFEKILIRYMEPLKHFYPKRKFDEALRKFGK